MRVGRRQASYKGSPDSHAVRAFLCLQFSAPQRINSVRLRIPFMSRLRLSHASTRQRVTSKACALWHQSEKVFRKTETEHHLIPSRTQRINAARLRILFYAPLAPVLCFDASVRDIKSVRLMASVREGV